jgi:hypothetical protein
VSDNVKRGIVFAAILGVILFALGLRIDHPKSGLRNALGSAESSVVVYWHQSKLSVGEKVIVILDKPALDPALAIINNINPDSIDVSTTGAFERVPNENVKGTLVMVFPFIGSLLGVFGL